MGDSVHVWVAPAGAESRATAHALLLDLAGTLVSSPSLHHADNGQPYVDGLAVSLSHSRDLVVVAASVSGPLGVDVEDIHPREVTALAQRWFDPAELQWMSGQPDYLIAFLHLWTAKEAVGKALGRGLRNSGLRRRMPLGGGAVESEPELVVTYVPWEGAVVALAAGAGLTEVVVTAHHGVALRRRVVSRTSFPVVVRGS
ncbi:4'-phosphopantetheinyl transferase superfamily protein [Kribbella capetownensis]|uniref:4'-phosphopantetheinyl transferase superfamily protein n=1 Tax=Kribbella capetownensis TaxID=1572659 RepID=A0A4R0K221_9ACTN|nr:4'-phosphopantetheinyl transferase superfamily protein [Kribbella capetownensis]TCC54013.1 4'-phosphopantetheinyl transferase superfamily protein [Kribbella capetownensis]